MAGSITDQDGTPVRVIDGALQVHGDIGLTSAEGLITSSGDTEVIAEPGDGKAIKVHWVYAANDPDASANPVIRVKWADDSEALYRGYAIAHREVFTAPANTAVEINLSANPTGGDGVAYTIHYEVVDL